MYVTTYITLTDTQGCEANYEVGAEVEYVGGGQRVWADAYEVGEPDVSAAGSCLDASRLFPDPQAGGVLADGWSDKVRKALTQVFIDDRCDVDDNRVDPDEYDDIYADREDGDYMYGEEG